MTVGLKEFFLVCTEYSKKKWIFFLAQFSLNGECHYFSYPHLSFPLNTLHPGLSAWIGSTSILCSSSDREIDLSTGRLWPLIGSDKGRLALTELYNQRGGTLGLRWGCFPLPQSQQLPYSMTVTSTIHLMSKVRCPGENIRCIFKLHFALRLFWPNLIFTLNRFSSNSVGSNVIYLCATTSACYYCMFEVSDYSIFVLMFSSLLSLGSALNN